MKVLVTNDDGVHSQGIIQLAKRVREYADVFVVAPQIEQSGVGQGITFLTPLFPIALGSSRDSQDDHIPGYSVNGTPVDCVKLALAELCPWTPDLVLSGINSGLNAGINVCYSGTVGGALAGATFGIPSMALSLESSPEMDYHRVAELAWPLIEKFYRTGLPPRSLINMNFPTAALHGTPDVAVVPAETNPMGYHFDQGVDPKGRRYFWSTNNPVPKPSSFETDTEALLKGKITVSAISYDLNHPAALSLLKESVQDQPVGGN